MGNCDGGNAPVCSTPVYDELLVWLIKARGARVVVECGTYKGVTTAKLARATEGHVYTVDDWRDEDSKGLDAWNHIIAEGLKGKVTFIEHDTTTYEWKGPPIDLLFLDASHGAKGIMAEWDLWTPRLAIGGVVAVHDTAPNPGHDMWAWASMAREGWHTVNLPWDNGLMLGVRA